MSTTAPPASVAEALAMLTSAASYLATADPAQISTQTQAECLAGLERAGAIGTAARTSVLGAFTAARGYTEDADYSPRSWLIHKTRITKGAATGHTAWTRRARTHPRILAAMAAGDLTESYARTLCSWTDKLPEDSRDAADAILAEAAVRGMGLRDLAMLAAEITSRACPPDDDGPGQGFQDRAARLVSAGLLPERAGQPARVWAHISLADLMVLDGSSKLQEEWTERVRARWAGHRAAASVAGSDGAAWLDGDAAEGFACDASVTPVVYGEVNYTVLDDLARLCVQLARHGTRTPASTGPAAPDPAAPIGSGPPAPPAGLSREDLELAIIGQAVALVSGPGGLASFLRQGLLNARLAGPSLLLDVGYSDDVPAGIRNAVRARDKFCQWAGGCHQPASACEVHHLRHKGHGGETSLDNCIMVCWYHHHVAIHRMGWTLVRNPDGTTTAWNRDYSKVLRSHSPPAPGNPPGRR